MVHQLKEEGEFYAILAADVVWMYDLVTPLVKTIKGMPQRRSITSNYSNNKLCSGLMGPKTITLLAHQSRSTRVDEALMSNFKSLGLKVAPVDDNLLDGAFRRPAVTVYLITHDS
jgi:hypothetical protein